MKNLQTNVITNNLKKGYIIFEISDLFQAEKLTVTG